MVVHLLLLCMIVGVFLNANVASAETVTLSQADVAERALNLSPKAIEANLSSQLSRLAYLQALATYDYVFSLESYLQSDRQQSIISTSTVTDTNANVSVLKLSKPFSSGTTIAFDSTYNRTTPYPLGAQSLYQFGFTFTQNLWRNFFGRADRATLRAAEKTEIAAGFTRGTALQTVVLDAIKLFWKTYVAQENFKESIASRERYEKLVGVVKRKSGLGYANPGELAQVQAELETRIQNVKTQSTNYLAAVDQLNTFLKLPAGTELKFKVPTEVPPIPKFEEVKIEQLRAIQAQRLKVEAAEDSLRASDSKDHPDLSLVAKLYQNGVDVDSSNAYNELISGVNPLYYIGFRFAFTFGSGSQAEESRNKKANRQLEQSRLDRILLETQDKLADSQRRIQAAYMVATSMSRQKELREKAATELQKAYNQGRTDISTFINALNTYFASIIAYSNAVGDYQIALNEYSSLRDELVNDRKTGELK